MHWEVLSGLPEVYEQLAPQPCGGENLDFSSPPRKSEPFVQSEEERGEKACVSTLETLSPVPGKPREQTPDDIVRVSVPDKNPPCPCSGSRVSSGLKLIEHLKGLHGKKRVCFPCAKCGKENSNYHSVVCHFAKFPGSRTCKTSSRRVDL